MQNRVEAVAAALVEIEAGVEAARHVRDGAAEEAAKIRVRAAALAGEREAIRRRRAVGELRDDDAGRLALLDLDAANLSELLAEAEGHLATADADHRRSVEALRVAEAEVAASSAVSEVAALARHGRDLARLLGETLNRHRAATSALRGHSDFEAARAGAMELADALDPALLRVMRSIAEMNVRCGSSRIAWASSEALATEIRRADLGRETTIAALQARGF